MQNDHRKESFAGALDRHFVACSAAAMAVSALTAGAHAAVVYSGPVNLSLEGPLFTSPEAAIDLNTMTAVLGSDFTSEIKLRMSTTNFRVDYGAFAEFDTRFVGFDHSGSNSVNRLAANTSIGSSSNFVSGGYLSYGKIYYGVPDNLGRPWNEWNGTSTNGFLGFKTTMPDGVHYGWVRMDITGGTNEMERLAWKAKIVDFAYEGSPGTAIIAGVVPEPAQAALGTLALGALGLRPNRRRSA